MPSLINHDRSLEFDHHCAVLIESRRLEVDDANVGRFNQLIREMSATTQVVLITHNKRSMEAADTLYGVTMQELGVSTVVSVRVF